MGSQDGKTAGQSDEGTYEMGDEFSMGAVPCAEGWGAKIGVRLKRRHCPNMVDKPAEDRDSVEWT